MVVESRGLESHENRLIQSHPSDVGVGSRSGDSSASLCALRAELSKAPSFYAPSSAQRRRTHIIDSILMDSKTKIRAAVPFPAAQSCWVTRTAIFRTVSLRILPG